MKPGRLKRYILIFSSLALMLTPVQLSDACGWSEDGYEPYTVIFDRDFFSPGSPKRFDLFSDVLFNFGEVPKDDHEKNTEEWQNFLKGISKENAYHLAYEANEQELSVLSKDLTDKNYADDIATALSQVEWQNIIRYLRFVRKCQPYVNEFDDWSGCFEKNDVFNGLFEEGEAIAASASSDFLKVRIGYQLCRLAHYMGQLDRTGRYYEQIVSPLKSESIIYYWAMAHYAASLKNDHKLADAQLHYAQVYRHCTTKRLSSFRSMYYSDIDSALAKCTDTADKISLYVLNSLENGSGNLKNMEIIHELDPVSPELELLLYKEIYTYEMDQSWRSSTDPENKTVPELLAFTEKVISEGKMYRPYIWHLSAGYLSFLNRSFEKAHEHYNAIKASTNTNVTLLKQYVTLLEVLLRTAETKNINTTFEESLLRYLTAMGSVQQGSALYEPSSRISQYVYQTLYAGYRNQGELVKAELVAPHFGNLFDASPMSLFDHPDSALVAGLVKFIARDDLNAFETYLLTKLPYKKNDLMELQGTMMFRLGHLEEAISFFDQSGELSQVAGDPFETKTIDCVDCGENPNAPTYTKKSLAQQIQKYEKLAVSEPKKAAEYYLLLGNAWYNMTSYGSTWQHLAYSRANGDLGNTTDPFEIYWKDGAVDTVGLAAAYKDEEPEYTPYYAGPFKRRQAYYYDCTRALNYYKKAFTLSRDDEFKAKCLFMAAKCEENARYVKESIKGLPIGTHTYYSKLYNDYSNTKFYSEIIGECAYLRNFKEFRDKNQ
jgi:hypothetical protein